MLGPLARGRDALRRRPLIPLPAGLHRVAVITHGCRLPAPGRQPDRLFLSYSASTSGAWCRSSRGTVQPLAPDGRRLDVMNRTSRPGQNLDDLLPRGRIDAVLLDTLVEILVVIVPPLLRVTTFLGLKNCWLRDPSSLIASGRVTILRMELAHAMRGSRGASAGAGVPHGLAMTSVMSTRASVL